MDGSEDKFSKEFERVLRARHGEVRAYLAVLGVPLDCVDDLAQEVFLTWLHAPDRCPPEVEPVRWLKGIARRMALNFFRQSKRQSERRLAVMAELLATEPTELPFATGEPAEAALEHCLREVSERNHAVLRLRYEEGLDSGVIGRRLEMSAEAVRILLMRVRAALRECILARLKREAT